MGRHMQCWLVLGAAVIFNIAVADGNSSNTASTAVNTEQGPVSLSPTQGGFSHVEPSTTQNSALAPSSLQLLPTHTFASLFGKQTTVKPSSTTVVSTPITIAVETTTVSNSVTILPSVQLIPTSIAVGSSSRPTTMKPTASVNTTVMPTAIPTPGVGPRQPFILFANREIIQIADLNGEGLQAVVNNSGRIIPRIAVGIDFDARNNYMFWSDISRRLVMRARLDGSEITTVIDSGVEIPDDIAYDWISEKIYWTDGSHLEIEVADLGGSGDRRILIKTGERTVPRAIVLDPITRWLYWTDWGSPAKIEKASMDGLNRTVIHSTNLTWPNALTIDYENQDLYWADAFLDKLETSKVDGSNRRLLSDRFILHPFSITFFEGFLYWTDWQFNAIVALPVNSPNQIRGLVTQLLADPMGIEVVSRDRQPEAPNPCATDNGNCSSLCLLSAVAEEGYTCACSEGMDLAPNLRDCLSRSTPTPVASPSPTPLRQGSCVAAGYSECCTNGDCLGEPPTCFCDAFCFDLDECCFDIALTCRQATVPIPLPSLPALSPTPVPTFGTSTTGTQLSSEILSSSPLAPNSVIFTPSASVTPTALAPSTTTLSVTSTVASTPVPSTPTVTSIPVPSTATVSVTPTPVGPSSEPYLLFGNRNFIRRSSLMINSTSEVIVNSSQGTFVGIDFDIRNNYMFWSDLSRRTIMRARLDGSEITTLVDTGILVPDNVAFDWVNGKLYWTDGLHREIEVMDVNTRDRRILLNLGVVSTPRAIVLDPITRWMYWTDWGSPAMIEKASMDGLNRTVLHNTDLRWPNALTIDYETQTLYWADGSLDKIESSNTDGSDRTLLTSGAAIPHPFSITFFRGVIYWSDWTFQAILSAPVDAADNITTIVLPLPDEPMAVHVIARERQPDAPNPCATGSGSCSSLCLLSAVAKEGYACACSEGMELAPNLRDCQEIPTTIVTPSPTPISGSCVAAGYSECCTEGECRGEPPVCFCDSFCYDLEECCHDIQLTCQRANTTSSVTSLLASPTPTPIQQPSGYLLFANRQTVRRLNFDGSGITTVISGQTNAVPLDIHFSGNYMYWADVSEKAIRRARLDGSEAVTIVNIGLVTPDGIAVDWINDKIYWTDADLKHIEVYEPSTKYRKVLLTTGNSAIPRAIVVDPRTRWVYWSDWGAPARIERSSMDGAARSILHNTSLTWPNALTLDYDSQVLYWADASLDKIESSNVDGSNRQIVTVRGLFHPFGITVFQDTLYWSDWRLDAILLRRLGDSQNTTIIFSGLETEPMAIVVVSAQRQPPALAPNPCSGSNCSHLCLLSAVAQEGFSCTCPQGFTLLSNERDCMENMNMTEPPDRISIGSCIDAGITDCNCDDVCEGEPDDCFCDLFCYELDDCCSDFREICPGNATASITPTLESTTTLAVSSSRLVRLRSSTSLAASKSSTPNPRPPTTSGVPVPLIVTTKAVEPHSTKSLSSSATPSIEIAESSLLTISVGAVVAIAVSAVLFLVVAGTIMALILATFFIRRTRPKPVGNKYEKFENPNTPDSTELVIVNKNSS